MQGTVLKINVKNREKFKQTGFAGLPKFETTEAEITVSGVADDYNDYRTKSKKSTLDRAVLIMTVDIMRQLEREGWPVKSGDIGENLTIDGLSYDSFKIGNIYRVGNAELQITEKCNPCTRLSNLQYVGEKRVNEFIKVLKNRRGWYAKVLREGIVRKGD
ncbi:MAG: MOSC domain-containing protein, partial [Candidatus Heimdallarchaeota archaeon]